MKYFATISIFFLLSGISVFSQVGINADNSQPTPSAGLDVKFTDKGLLLPRMTRVQMEAIATPANGLITYCTDCSSVGTGALAMCINGLWYIFTTSCLNQMPPTAGTHIPGSHQISWNWNPMNGATGYKWNTTNNFATATEMWTATTKMETGLLCNTSYTRYAWAYNACNSFSSAIALTQSTSDCSVSTCGQLLTDARDGKTYSTVLIGTQCWMTQNMNIGTAILSTIPQSDNGYIEKYCYPTGNTFCDVYGGLYQWNEMMQWFPVPGSRGICPTGWHIPTDAEWTTLTTSLGGENVAGGKMKEAGPMNWNPPNTGATNSSGFTALPGGICSNGNFVYLTYYGFYWSSTQSSSEFAWIRILYNELEGVVRDTEYGYKPMGYSVRCLRNN